MAQSAGGQDLLSILADVAEEEHEGLAGTRTASIPPSGGALPVTTADPPNGGFPAQSSSLLPFDFSSIIDEPPAPIPFTSGPSTLSQAANGTSAALDFSWLDNPPSRPIMPQPSSSPMVPILNKSLSLPPQFIPNTPTPSFSVGAGPVRPIAPLPMPIKSEDIFGPSPTPLHLRPSMTTTPRPPSVLATPNTPPGAATQTQKHLESLMSRIPTDKHPMLFTLFSQLQNKIITTDVFITKAKAILEPSNSPHSQARLPIPRSSMSHTPSSLSEGDGILLPKVESPMPMSGILKRPYDTTLSPPDTKRTRHEPMLTRRASAQLNAPIQLTNPPPPSDFSAPSFIPATLAPGTSLKLPAQSSAQAKGKGAAGATEVDVTKLDVDSMMDVTSYGGVDLREEEDNLGLAPGANLPPSNPLGIDRSKLQDFLNLAKLRKMVETIGKKHGIKAIDDEFLVYLALAAKERTRDLLEKMVTASKHRVGILLDRLLEESNDALSSNAFPKPPRDAVKFTVSVSNDVRRMVQMTEYMEREEDNRERIRLHPDGSGKSALETARAAAMAAQAAGTAPDGSVMAPLMMMPAAAPSGFSPSGNTAGLEGGSFSGGDAVGASGSKDASATVASEKPKKKKGKKASAAGNELTEAIKARQVNTTALLAAGGAKAIKSWMLPQGAGGVGSMLPGSKKKKAKAADSSASASTLANKPVPGRPVDPKVAEEEAALAKLAKVGVYRDDTGREVKVVRAMTVREMTRVTLRDALFCLEGEQQMASSPLLYKWLGKIN
ncbi:hypothetical protein HDU67_005887 [Dinochytrium kinnereticum]|nr:hypothetical protein HDU67_005887 [Dinochytrium kinnereticum]